MADSKTLGGPILEVEKLNIRFNTPVGVVHAVRDVSFTMGREKLAIVGESGSGKSQTGRAILGLTPGKVTRSMGRPCSASMRGNGARSAASASPW